MNTFGIERPHLPIVAPTAGVLLPLGLGAFLALSFTMALLKGLVVALATGKGLEIALAFRFPLAGIIACRGKQRKTGTTARKKQAALTLIAVNCKEYASSRAHDLRSQQRQRTIGGCGNFLLFLWMGGVIGDLRLSEQLIVLPLAIQNDVEVGITCIHLQCELTLE